MNRMKEKNMEQRAAVTETYIALVNNQQTKTKRPTRMASRSQSEHRSCLCATFRNAREQGWDMAHRRIQKDYKHADMLCFNLSRTTKYPSLKGVDPKFRRNAKVG